MNKYAVQKESLLGPAHGPYSQGLVCGDLFFSGVIGSGSDGEVVSESVYEQTIRLLQNVQALLQEAGGDLSHLVKVTVYLLQMSDFDEMNRAYKEMITSYPLPARATIAVKEMLPGVKVEMEVMARL